MSLSLGSMLAMKVPSGWTDLSTAGVLFEQGNPIQLLRLYFMDTEITESMTANYEQNTMVGRTSPLYAFQNVSGKTVSLNLHFVADVCPALQVHQKIKWLQTFLYPQDNGVHTIPPKKVILSLGFYLGMRGVITEVTAVHKPPFAGLGFGSENSTFNGFFTMFPVYATVAITIAETEAFWTGGQPDYEQARRDANLRFQGIPIIGTDIMGDSVLPPLF